MRFTEFNGAERFAALRRMMIDYQCRPFLDFKGLAVKHDTQEWYVGPPRPNVHNNDLFTYYMIDTVNEMGLFMISCISFEVSVMGFAIVSGFAQNKSTAIGTEVLPNSWRKAVDNDWTRLLGYRSAVPFWQFAHVGIQQLTFIGAI